MQQVNRRVVVTGAAGFLGSHIAIQLRRRGLNVVAMAHRHDTSAWLRRAGFEVEVGDIRDRTALHRIFRGADAVVHAAGLTSHPARPWQESVDTNIVGSVNVLDAAARAGAAHMVHISSVAGYVGRPWSRPNEQWPLLEGLPAINWSGVIGGNAGYAATKAMAEKELRTIATGLDIALTILRPGPLIGPRDHKLTSVYARAMTWPLFPVPTVRITHAYTPDVARLVLAVLASPASHGRVYNVTGEFLAPLDVLRCWKALVGRGPILIPVPIPLWVDYDDSAVRRELGFTPTPLAQQVEEIVTELADRNGWMPHTAPRRYAEPAPAGRARAAAAQRPSSK